MRILLQKIDKEIRLLLGILLIFTLNFPSRAEISEEHLAAFRQIYESLTEDSREMQEAARYEEKIRELDLRLRPKEEELREIRSEAAEIGGKARLIINNISAIDSTLSKLSASTAREVLRVLLRLLVETANAMNSRGKTDQVITLTRETINHIRSAEEEQVPVLVELIRNRREAEESRQEMRENYDEYMVELRELNSRENILEREVDLLRRERENLRRSRDNHIRSHERAISTYLRSIPDELKRAASQAEDEIEADIRVLREAESKREPDFIPFIEAEERLSDSLLKGRLSGRDYERSLDRIKGSANIHYRAALRAETPEAAGSVERAYQAYQERSEEIEREVEAGKRAFLERLNELDAEILQIDTRFIRDFTEAYKRQIERVNRAADSITKDDMSVRGMERISSAKSDASREYLSLAGYLSSAKSGFSERLRTAEKNHRELSGQRESLVLGGAQLATYVGYNPPSGIREVEAALREGKTILDSGPLSEIYIINTENKGERYRERGEFYAEQADFNREYSSALSDYLRKAEELKVNLPLIRNIFGEETREYINISSRLRSWEDYRKRFNDNPRATLGRLTTSELQRYTLDDHTENIEEVKRIIGQLERLSNEYGILYSLKAEADLLKPSVEELSEETREILEKEKDLAEVLRQYESLFSRRLDFLEGFRNYLRIYEEFSPLKESILSDLRSALRSYTRIADGYESAADPEAYANNYFDEAGRYRENIPADRIMARYNNFVFPFSSDEVEMARHSAESARLSIFSLGSRVRDELFRGPEIIEMRSGDRSFRPGVTYRRVPELSREDLINERIRIEGSFRVYGEPASRVLISKDGGVSYTYQGELRGSDSFLYEFSPNIGVEYNIRVKVEDQRGNTGRGFPYFGAMSFIYTGYSNEEAVESFFMELAESYRRKDILLFMDLVAPNYVGRAENLERAAEMDFENFDAIDMRYFINDIRFSPDRNNATVSASWRRSWTDINNNSREREEGENSFRLVNDAGEWRLYSYSGAPLFGRLVDLPIESSTEGGRLAGRSVLPINRNQELGLYFGGIGFSFENRDIRDPSEADLGFNGDDLISFDGGIIDMGGVSLNQVTEAPSSGYSFAEPAFTGNTYVIETINGNYAKIRLTNVTTDNITFDWVYQPNGSRDLR